MKPQAQKTQPLSVAEFEAMPRDERFSYELIDGVVMMSPSPSFEHQKIGSNCTYSLREKMKLAGRAAVSYTHL